MSTIDSEIISESNQPNENINKRLEFLYKQKGFPKPIILIFDSPLSCKLAYKLLLVLLNKEFNLGELHLNLKIKEDNSESIIRYFPPIIQRLKYQKETENTFESVRKGFWNILEKTNGNCSWDLYSENSKNLLKDRLWIKLINNKTNYFEYDSNKYWNFDYDLYSEGIFYSIFLNPICILCKKPKYILTDNRSNLHCEDGKSIEFLDGFGIYSVHGVLFDTGLYKKIYIDRNITPDGILGIKNIEHRALAIQFYGYDKLIRELHAEKLDEWRGFSAITNLPILCELFEFSIARRRFRFVKVEDYSTHKITSLGVPIMEQTETVVGAIAWTFEMEEDEYRPKIHT